MTYGSAVDLFIMVEPYVAMPSHHRHNMAARLRSTASTVLGHRGVGRGKEREREREKVKDGKTGMER